MSQLREPPAFQEYASDMLSSRRWRLMTAAERGLLYSMRLESWVNRTLPLDPRELALILGLDAGEVRAALPVVMSFFAIKNGEIQCPELDKYRAHLEGVRDAKIAGGKRGADATNKKKQQPKTRAAAGDSAMPPGMPSGMPSAEVRHLSTAKTSQTQSSGKKIQGLSAVDPWVAAYEAGERKPGSNIVEVIL